MLKVRFDPDCLWAGWKVGPKHFAKPAKKKCFVDRKGCYCIVFQSSVSYGLSFFFFFFFFKFRFEQIQGEGTGELAQQQNRSRKGFHSGSVYPAASLGDLAPATLTAPFPQRFPRLVQRFPIWSCQKGFHALIAEESRRHRAYVSSFSELLFLHY